jgi:Flp pilus assembly protein TadD
MGKNAFSDAECLRAERYLLDALAGGAKYPDIHYTLGLIDHQRGNYRRAVERFGQAVSLNPDYTEALLSLSITLNDMGLYDEAREAYDRAAEILSRRGGSPGENLFRGRIANLHKELGELYLALGQHDDAIREYRHALSVAPGYPDLRVRLVTALREAGRTDEARNEVDAFLAEIPGNAAALIQKGILHYLAGESTGSARGKRHSTRTRSTSSQVYLNTLGWENAQGWNPGKALPLLTLIPTKKIEAIVSGTDPGTPGLGHVLPAAAAAAHQRRRLPNDVGGREPPGEVGGDPGHQMAPFPLPGSQEQDPARELPLHRVGQIAQRRGIHRLHLGRNTPDPGNLLRAGEDLAHQVPRRPPAGLLERFLQRLDLRGKLSHPLRYLRGRHFQLPGHAVKRRGLLPQTPPSGKPCDRLEAPDPGGHRTLGEDVEQADLGGVPHVRPAAQFPAHLRDGHHPDDVRVLLPEERHRARRHRLFVGQRLPRDGPRGEDDPVHLLLDRGKRFGRERLEVGKVEPELRLEPACFTWVPGSSAAPPGAGASPCGSPA